MSDLDLEIDLDKQQINFEDRRADPRIEQAADLTVKIVFSSSSPGLLGKNLDGKTVDISASGLRVSLDRPIDVDSVLDVWVMMKKENKKYFLTGNVRWCNETEQPGIYHAGVVLRERTDTITDLRSWRKSFKN
ncbi:MAG: PilZ domain-containing protein [Gammaproteobacteria bacterium]|nr:PilZ domain-containing protein [Gammaproteobacteria bacterium]